MKAVVIYKNGDLDCVKVENVAEPKPDRNEVLVEVRSAALNHLDLWVIKGRLGVKLEKPHILGSDASGIVIQTGSDTHGFKIGDEVLINPGLVCGCCDFCQKGEQSLCSSFGIIGMTRPGTYAEKIAVPFYNLWPKPAYMNFNEAAAMSLVFHTAWRMLVTRGALTAGQIVLIHGIGGGVALAALQLAKLIGAKTIVTSSSDEKLSKAKKIGADFTVNYKTASNVADEIKKATDNYGVDLIIDTVGASTWDLNFSVVRRGGRIILCGVTTGDKAQTDLQKLYWNQVIVLGSTLGSHNDFR